MGQSATKYQEDTIYKEGEEYELDEESTNDEDDEDDEDYEFESSSETEDEEEEEESPEKRVQLVNLLTLSTDELQSHLSNYTFMTKHDVRNIAFTEEQCNEGNEVGSQEWYQQQKLELKASTDNDEGKATHMDVAMEILNLSPEIRSLRFQLVPAKLSESVFWSAVFYALEYYTIHDLGATETLPGAMKKKKKDDPTITTAAASSFSDENFTLEMKRKDDELQLLKKLLSQAKEDIAALQKQLSSSSTKKEGKPHTGKWVMSKESKEFLALDENIKQQLREGKRKRIEEVHEQMKFIMDSDDVKDSQGHWECCGNTVYDSYMLK